MTIRKTKLFTVLAILFLLAQGVYGQWLAGYLYRKKITIQASQVPGSSNLTDFPVLIEITSTDLKQKGSGGGVANANGWDTRFTAADKITTLNHEIERYDAATGTLTAWVRIPSLSPTTNTDIYLYFGNTSISSDPSTSSTWNSNYLGVWHLHDDFNDATANNIDGTATGTTNSTGQIADGQNFNNGNPDYIDLGNSSVLNFGTENWTLSAWVNTSSTSGQQNILGKGAENYSFWFWTQNDDGYFIGLNGQNAFIEVFDGNNGKTATSVTNLSANIWYYITGQKIGDYLQIYVNGSLESSVSGVINYDLSRVDKNPAYIGIGRYIDFFGGNNFPYRSFGGDIDEARIVHTALSQEWIQTEYNNQSNPSAFYIAGSTEAVARYAIKSGNWNDP
ncbi:MAG TPA: DUF2341 domain-containing protein, partial [Bacteroidetes bacterium]|nr:DUF2341 domain-containing protein [Bacteroidota bacterium]